MLYSSFVIAGDQPSPEGGDRMNPVAIEIDGVYADLRKSLATSTTWDAWASDAEEPVTDFDFLWIESDQDVLVELTCDQNNGVGREEMVIEVIADKPWYLCSDDSHALYTADFAAGTADVIDRIRVRNVSGSTANVRVFLAT